MTEPNLFRSVADMMRKEPSVAEAQLIKPGWSSGSLFFRKAEGRAGRH